MSDAYMMWVGYLAFGFVLGAIGIAVVAPDEGLEVAAILMSYTFAWPLMLVIAIVVSIYEWLKKRYGKM
jgi:hypothetical protein